MSRLRLFALAVTATFTLAACDSVAPTSADASVTDLADARSFNANGNGAVFTLSNEEANAVVAFRRAADGTLESAGTFATGGAGGPLGASTDPLVLSPDGRYLYAVNNGSDDVSVFQVTGNRLQLRQTVSSGGVGPFSIAIQDDLVYVLNVGGGDGAGNVVAFDRGRNGRLSAIDGGAYAFPTDGSAAGLTQVSFNNDGTTAVVTARAANNIFAFSVAGDGTPGAPTVNASAGQTAFGFDFDAAGRLYVSEAAGGAPDASTVSGYVLDGTTANVIAGATAVRTEETAACWIVTTGPYLYTTNTADGTITGFRAAADGSITLLDADGITATTGTNPRDLNVAGDFVYAQSDGQIDVYEITRGVGSLTPVQTIAVPAGARGAAVR